MSNFNAKSQQSSFSNIYRNKTPTLVSGVSFWFSEGVSMKRLENYTGYTCKNGKVTAIKALAILSSSLPGWWAVELEPSYHFYLQPIIQQYCSSYYITTCTSTIHVFNSYSYSTLVAPSSLPSDLSCFTLHKNGSTCSNMFWGPQWCVVNQDSLGSRQACMKVARHALASDRSVVIDRCNVTAMGRLGMAVG